MRIQISSGQGPAECELAVGLLYEELKRGFDIRLSFTQEKSGRDFPPSCLRRNMIFTSLEGSILWICKSPYRPEHKRKTGMWMRYFGDGAAGDRGRNWFALRPLKAAEKAART